MSLVKQFRPRIFFWEKDQRQKKKKQKLKHALPKKIERYCKAFTTLRFKNSSPTV